MSRFGGFFIGDDDMSEELITHVIGNVGVPAAICFYTLFRVNNTLKDLTDAINRLSTDNDRRLDKVESEIRELRFKIETSQR